MTRTGRFWAFLCCVLAGAACGGSGASPRGSGGAGPGASGGGPAGIDGGTASGGGGASGPSDASGDRGDSLGSSGGASADSGGNADGGGGSAGSDGNDRDGGLAALACGVLGWGAAPFGAVSPDGSLLAIASEPARLEIRRWADTSKVVLANGANSANGVHAVAFSGDGTLVAAADDNRLAVWRTADGTLVRELFALAEANKISLSADGSVIAAALRQAVVVWSASDPTLRTLVDGRVVLSVAVSPDGTRVAATSHELNLNLSGARGFVSLWSAADGTRAWEQPLDVGLLPSGHAPPARVVFSPDGTLLARGTMLLINQIFVLRAVDGTVQNTLALQQPWGFSPDGRRLVATDGLGTEVVNLPDGAVSMVAPDDLDGSPLAATMTADGVTRTLRVRPSMDSFALLEDATAVRSIPANGLEASLGFVGLSTDGRRLAIAAPAGTTSGHRLWDLAGPSVIDARAGGGPIVLSPDGQVLLRAAGTHLQAERGRSYDVTTSLDASGIAVMTLSTSGRLVALGDALSRSELRSVADGSLVQTFAPEGVVTATEGITSFAISPDESVLAIGDGARRWLTLSRVSDGSRLSLVPDSDGALVGLAYTPDGRYLVSLNRGGLLKLRTAADGMPTGAATQLVIPGASALALSADGTIAYVAATAGVLPFALPAFTPLPGLHGHTLGVLGVAVSADGKRVASVSGDGTTRIHCLP